MARTIKNRVELLFGFVLVFCLSTAAQAAITLWNGGGDATSWSDNANWSAGSPTATSNVQFDAVVNNSNTTMDLGNISIASYEQPRVGGTHQFNLGTSALTTNSLSLSVQSDETSGGSAFLTVHGSAGSALNVTGLLAMAKGRGRLTSLTLDPGVALNIGINPSTRGSLSMIESSALSHATNTATLTPGNTFNAYLTNLYVAADTTSFYGDAVSSTATLALGSVSSGVLDVSSKLLIGDGYAMTGNVTVSNAMNVKVGVDNSNRAILSVASAGGKRESFAASSFVLGSGSLQAYLSQLNVAYVTSFSEFAGADNYSATGTLDASNVGSGFIDVAGPVRVGTVIAGNGQANNLSAIVNNPAYSPNAIGTLKLSAIDVNSYSLQVGDANNRILRNGVAGNIGRGTLELHGTRFSVRDSVIVDGFDSAHAGLVSIDVLGESAGLMLDSSATLTVGNGSIDITFLAPDGDVTGNYFGLSWEGDHVAELLALGSKLTWDDAAVTAAGNDAVSIYFAGGFTYVGTIILPVPEPTSGALMALGAIFLFRRRRA